MRAGSTVVAVSGPIDHDVAIGQVERAFAAIAPGDGRVRRDAPGAPTRGELIDDDTEQVHIVLGMQGLQRDDEDREPREFHCRSILKWLP